MASSIKYTDSQRGVIDDFSGKMIVSASAGSGKTTVMIERIANVVRQGGTLDSIVALTFTNASARDMKAKLEKKITALALEDSRYFAEVEKIPFIDVETVDTLCKRIVTEYFEIAGIDPAFAVCDEGDKASYYRRAFSALSREKESSDAFYRLKKILGGEEKLRSALEARVAFLDALPEPEAWLSETATVTYKDSTTILERWLSRVRNEAEYLIKDAERFSADTRSVPGFSSRLEALGHVKCVTDYASLPIDFSHIKFPNFIKSHYEKCPHDVAEIKEWIEDAKEIIQKVSTKFNHVEPNEESRALAEEFVDSVRRFVHHLSRLKSDDNKLDFADIERLALKVLENEGVRERVLSRYAYVCVDEYQDINELQEKIIERLTGENKFMVGDVKQSIYAFRHSEPQIFVNTARRADVKKRELKENFRSDPKVIGKINDVFTALMREDSGVSYRDEAMNAQRSYGDGIYAPVYFTCFEKKESTVNWSRPYSVKNDYRDETLVSQEVLAVANAVVSMVESGEIYDADLGQRRRIRYGDVAVIVRSRKEFYYELASVLRSRGVPVGVDSARADTPEINALINLVRVLDNGEQDVPLASVMLKIFGFTEEELVEIAGTANSFTESVEKARGEKVENFRKRLEGYRFNARYMGVAEILRRVCEAEGYYERLTTGERAKVRDFIIACEGLPCAENTGKFLELHENYLEKMMSSGERGEDAVTLMTMHASKGLEFPIVFLGDLGRDFFSDNTEDCVFTKEFGAMFKNVDGETRIKSKSTQYNLLLEERSIKEHHELVRLLYVAMTRAKNHLFLTGTAGAKRLKARSSESALSFLQMILFAIKENPELNLASLEDGLSHVQGEAGEEKKSACALNVEEILRAMRFEYPHREASRTGVKFAVTALAVDGEEQVGKPFVMEEEFMREGTLYHKVMESLSFNLETVEEIDREIKKLVELHTITKAEEERIDREVVLRALSSDVIKLARGKRCYREYHFMLSAPARDIGVSEAEDEVLVQGVIDLLILDGDEAVIVDYKHTASSGDRLRDRYKKQLDLYAGAVSSALGVRVKRKVILSLKSGEETEV